MVSLKKNKFVQCKDICDEIILEYSDNLKAYYRKGKFVPVISFRMCIDGAEGIRRGDLYLEGWARVR
jgi:hypothetical protein